jgi:hypothetical protein
LPSASGAYLYEKCSKWLGCRRLDGLFQFIAMCGSTSQKAKLFSY